jgi:hypothetical protein
VALERDFVRIDVPGIPATALESSLSDFETLLGPVLAGISNTEALPRGTDFSILINLMALIATRNPRMRAELDRVHDELLRQVVALMTATRERYEAMTERYAAWATNDHQVPTYEQFRELTDPEKWAITVPRMRQIQLEISVFDDVLQALAARRWTLTRVTASSGPYVCGDHPLVLDWIDPQSRGAGPPGYALEGTVVTFPINHTFAIVGFLNHELAATSSDSLVAQVNGQTVRGARNHVFCSTMDFYYRAEDGTTVQGNQLIDGATP